MKRSARRVAVLLAAALVVQGCSSGGSGRTPESGEGAEPPRRPPRLATLYVETKGEPLNAGGRKVEKADETGESKGEFSAKDLLMPGMFVLVSGATALGGPLLIKALDRKEKPSGPSYVASGGGDGTFVPAEISGGASGGGSGTGSGAAGSGSPDGIAPDPADVVATAGDKAGGGGKAVAAGHGIVSTPTSVLLTMGYATDYSGPSYITGKLSSSGSVFLKGEEVHVYRWTLTVSRSEASREDRVDVYATFTGLPKGALVQLYLSLDGTASFTCDHRPLVYPFPSSGLREEWYFTPIPPLSSSGRDDVVARIGSKVQYALIFRLPAPDMPIRLGYLTVYSETEIAGESTAEVTVH